MIKSVQQLQQQVSDNVLTRADSGYGQIRRGWDLTIDHYPVLQPLVRGGVWMNFMNGNGRGAQECIREAYRPEAYERLLALKTKYDPDNMFRFSYQLGRSGASGH